MKITIVIPVYNGESYIRGALESCISQTYTDIDILIVNDGSTDSTLEIIKEYESIDSRIRHVSQPNSGLVRARKMGVENTLTDYFVFLDSDDALTSDAVQCLMEKYNETKADIVFSNFTVELDSGKTLSVSNNRFYNSYDSITVLNNIFLKNIAPTIWGKLIRKELFLQTNTPDDITIGEDAVAIVQMLLLKPKIAFIKNIIYHYIQRANSMVNTTDIEKNQKRLYFISYLKEYILSSFSEYSPTITSLKCFFMIEFFDILRDGGDFSDIRENYRWATSARSLFSYRKVLGVSRVLMLYCFSINRIVGISYRYLFNKIRTIRYSI